MFMGFSCFQVNSNQRQSYNFKLIKHPLNVHLKGTEYIMLKLNALLTWWKMILQINFKHHAKRRKFTKDNQLKPK